MDSFVNSRFFPSIFKRKASKDGNKNSTQGKNDDDQWDSEKQTINWSISLFRLKEHQGASWQKRFKAGESLGLPTEWEFTMKCICIENKKYWGLFLSEVSSRESSDLDKKDSDELKNLYAEFSTVLFTPESTSITFHGAKTDFKQKKYYGIKKLLDVDQLHQYQVHGLINIQITFTLYKPSHPQTVADEDDEPSNKKMKKSQDEDQDDIQNDIMEAIRSHIHTDMVLKTKDDKEFNVHRVVLAARSDYLSNAISHELIFENSRPVLRVEETFDVMKSIICYIYSGEKLEILVNPEVIDIALAQRIAEAAKLFGLESLWNFILDGYPGLKERIEKEDAEKTAVPMIATNTNV